MKVIDLLKKALDENRPVATATIVRDAGSSPRGTGSMMLVGEDGLMGGSIGGGALEFKVIQDAIDAIRDHQSVTLSYPLDTLNMECGGDVDVFIQVYPSKEEVLIVGGGHIAQAMIPQLKSLGFIITVIDEREGVFEPSVFEGVTTVNQPINVGLNHVHFHKLLYSVIVTHGHQHDEEALGYIVNQKCKYVGMIGSTKKIKGCFNHLMNQGCTKDQLKEVYAPIGLALGGESPEEIALGIVAEIQSVRYQKDVVHMKDVKLVEF